MPRTTRGVGSNRPMTPVELTRTSRGEQPTASATARHIASASRTPRAPVAELLMPLLHTIARATPAVARRGRLLAITGAPTTRFVVKTPAAAHGTSATINARSGLPDGLIPQTPPAAVKPRQRVIDPLCAMSRARMVGPRAPSCTPNDHGGLANAVDAVALRHAVGRWRDDSTWYARAPMDAYRAVVDKRDQRAFLPKALPDEALRRILQAGRMTGSSKNREPNRFVVVRDRERKRAIAGLSRFARWLADAAVVVVIVQTEQHEFDAGRCAQNMMVTA